MAKRFVKDAFRTETPRLKDLHVQETARDPSEGRQEHGHFGPDNRISEDQGTKALIRKGLGDPSDPLTGELVRASTRLYRAILRSLPSDGPGVRQLVASQARHALLATHYANEAAKAGFASDRGLKLAEASRAHDTTAQRLAVTAYDRAVREAAAKPKRDPLAWLTAPALRSAQPPESPQSASEPSPTAERVVAPAIDMVDGPGGDE